MFYKKNVNPYSKYKSVDKILIKLRKMIIICKENIYHILKPLKQANDKNIKLRSFFLSNKVWLNSKYIKIKQN